MSDEQIAVSAGHIVGGEWVAPGLRTGGSMAALEATMRPIDALHSTGLGFLAGYVQPLQATVDRMAGNASAIRSVADTWHQVSAQVHQIQQSLTRAVATETTQWQGAAADGYRARAGEISSALNKIATLATAVQSATTTMGQALAESRQQAGNHVAALVQQLISGAGPAIAVEGGVTPAVLAQAAAIISSSAPLIAMIEQQLRQTIGNVQSHLTTLADAMNNTPTTAATAS